MFAACVLEPQEGACAPDYAYRQAFSLSLGRKLVGDDGSRYKALLHDLPPGKSISG